MTRDCPKDVIEVRRNDDGTLDEIVATGCDIHLEMLDDNLVWIGIYKDGYRQVVNITARKGGIMSERDM